ncbi:MAG: succinate dehydrogenase, cytochrome b556 subunit [Methylococcales bacterium]|nr:succinate dehydrogenase, cytochrome b556 subunit [Methylococcales bacterium]
MPTHSNRPISPHLQAYRLPLTGIISITHRMTGVFLSVGLVAVIYILLEIAGGAADYTSMQQLLNVWLIKLAYWGFIYALFFHLCHGVRHLIWDTGRSFEPETLERYALIELAASVVLTFIALV